MEKKNGMKLEEISETVLSKYIKQVEHIVQKYPDEIIVFRGETEDYKETACLPNIYRKGYIQKNPFFEKNLLDEMAANGLALGNSYLENAINAQHDGFPSRLLDVSFNCLIGLHFAITPYYKYAEDSKDDSNGYVYVYHIKKSVSALGSGIQDNYNAIVTRSQSWYNDESLFSSNFKFIEHMRINDRIKAQQGAFILFQGNEPHQLPKYLYDTIEISKYDKEGLRKVLRTLFNIDNGTVYPEAYNLVDQISVKSLRVSETEFSLSTELKNTLTVLDDKVDYLLSLIPKADNLIDHIRSIEKEFLIVKNNYGKFKENIIKKKIIINSEILMDFKITFNKLASDTYSYLQDYLPDNTKIKMNGVKIWEI